MPGFLVLVGGSPGAGKSTLTAQIAPRLRLPVINRDLIKGGLWFTRHGATLAGPTESFPVFAEVVEGLLLRGVSVVAESTFGSLEHDLLERWQNTGAAGHLLWCESEFCVDRLAVRMAEENYPPEQIRDLPITFVAQAALFARPPEHFAVTRVCTDDGYDPTLEALIAVIHDAWRTDGRE